MHGIPAESKKKGKYSGKRALYINAQEERIANENMDIVNDNYGRGIDESPEHNSEAPRNMNIAEENRNGPNWFTVPRGQYREGHKKLYKSKKSSRSPSDYSRSPSGERLFDDLPIELRSAAAGMENERRKTEHDQFVDYRMDLMKKN